MGYSWISIEISGRCNAQCKWCVTGSGETKKEPSQFMSRRKFEEIITDLHNNGEISRKTTIHLYNWGEPFLNPELLDILKVISDRGHKYVLSTNASRYIQIPKYLQKNLATLIISMPGFGQDSYDKIHKFSFDKIISNIKLFMNDINPGKILVNIHIYQFNQDELRPAIAFFTEHGISVYPSFAYFNNYNVMIKYLDKTLPEEVYSEAVNDICLDYVDNLLLKSSENYHCPQWDSLTIDEFGRKISCCVIPKNHPAYQSNDRAICNECISSGVAYWAHHPESPDFAKKLGEKYFLKKIVSRYIRNIMTISL